MTMPAAQADTTSDEIDRYVLRALNEGTLAATAELESGAGRRFGTAVELFADLNLFEGQSGSIPSTISE